ncbi:hypothetical protein DL96DRAFT_1601928 [Flagelloscypha sp. PMI_526]|nr:hypothetical protein DL96DRAFT_1601928 [Flagelloscypha sp. PMI_526]
MRRAQSLRHHGRPSNVAASDELGVLGEDDTNEDLLRKQLLEKDRENDRLTGQIHTLQTQLASRPPLERVQQLEKDYKSLELILQGTQRENEKAMASLDRAKAREKALENELQKLLGENWQSSLELSTAPSIAPSSRSLLRGGNTSLLTVSALSPQNTPSLTDSVTSHEENLQHLEAQAAHIESVRMLVLGMQQQLETREAALTETLERAEKESKTYQGIVKANTSALKS